MLVRKALYALSHLSSCTKHGFNALLEKYCRENVHLNNPSGAQILPLLLYFLLFFWK